MSWADNSAEEEMSPWGSGQRVPPKAGALCLPLSASCSQPQRWPEQVGKQQSCLYLGQREQGQAPSQQELANLHSVCFTYSKLCVCEPGMVASACNSITQEAEAGKTLSKEKKKDFHKAGLSLPISLSVPAPGLSWPPSHVPSSTDILAVFERELSYGGH